MAQPRPKLSLIAAIVLVLIRVAVSFQFQSATPLLPLVRERMEVSNGGLGLLLSLYMAPGILVAFGLPVLLGRLGRSRMLAAAFTLMICGETLFLAADSFQMACIARLTAGFGGCVIYILTINMMADLADMGAPAARMGAIAASWPFGNALALLLLGHLLETGGAWSAQVPLAIVIVAATLMAALLLADRRQGGSLRQVSTGEVSWHRWRMVVGRVLLVSLSFALYNSAFIALTSFAPTMLQGWGMEPATAAAIASLPMWMFLVSVPLGGFLAAGMGSRAHMAQIAAGCLGGGLCVVAAGCFGGTAFWFVAAGLLGGLPTAPMLSRAAVISGQGADITYSVVFLIFFATLLFVPPSIGYVADYLGNTDLPVFIISALLVMSVFVLVISGGRKRS